MDNQKDIFGRDLSELENNNTQNNSNTSQENSYVQVEQPAINQQTTQTPISQVPQNQGIFVQNGAQTVESTNQDVNTQNVVEEVVERPTSVVEFVDPNISVKDDSYNEMPFVGVNQSDMTVTEENIMDKQIEVNDNMKPVEEVVDENSGLKFLLVIGIILAIAIILLPVFLKL